MRRVPRYTIIGNGRMATHICHYLTLLGIEFSHWHRNLSLSLEESCKNSDAILILISDAAIDDFIEKYSWLQNHTLIHFSGSLVSKYAIGAHPLMSFGNELYDLKTYKSIPFIIEEGNSFSELLPGLPNNSYPINKNLKPFYHAMCVLANNFTTILWQKFFEEMKNLNIPQQDILPYLQQTFINLRDNPETALTGPLARNDIETITKDLQALENDEFYRVFYAFTEEQT